MGLGTTLREIYERSEAEIARQIQHILNQLEKTDDQDAEPDSISQAEDEVVSADDNADFSTIGEQEIDYDIVSRGIPTGEELLSSEFACSLSKTATQDLNAVPIHDLSHTPKDSDHGDNVLPAAMAVVKEAKCEDTSEDDSSYTKLQRQSQSHSSPSPLPPPAPAPAPPLPKSRPPNMPTSGESLEMVERNAGMSEAKQPSLSSGSG